MPSSLYIPTLIAGMIITGSSNSLWSKWQDMQCVENCSDPDLKKHVLYAQPVWQTLQMFLGEMLCFLPVLYTWIRTRRQSGSLQLPSDSEEEQVLTKPPPQQLRGWKYLLLWLPAACDLTGTTLMNIGLLYTPVSIYQMTRGALVLFVGILSVLFLHRRLWPYQWLSLFTVMGGIALVGFSGSLIKDAVKESVGLLTRAIYDIAAVGGADLPVLEPIEKPETTQAVIGILLVLFAQVFLAIQFVIEEKILSRYSVAPLVGVGFEGLFGFTTILLLIPILSIPAVSSKSTFFDLPRGWHQMVDNPPVLWSGVAIAISIAFFNFFGLSVTRHVSATARSLTDQCRTLSIWLVSLGLGWEKILFPITLLQVLGFSFLVYGTLLFNDLIYPPPFLRPPEMPISDSEEGEGLLQADLPASSDHVGL